MAGETKALLKEAREAIAAKQFSVAVDSCRSLLSKDPRSYMGLVLLGVALQQDPQAPLTFHRALDIDRTKPLAWQGLATYYEKHEGADASEKLLSIYHELLKVNTESGKVAEILGKLCALGLNDNTCQVLNILTQYFSEITEESIRQTAENKMLQLLRSDNIVDCDISSILSVIDTIVETHSDDEKLVLNYAKLMSKNNNLSTVMNRVMKLKGFGNNKPLQEWMCSRVFEEYVDRGTIEDGDLTSCQKLLTDVNLQQSSLLQCVLLFDKGFYKEAYELGIKLLDAKNLDDVLALFLIKCTVCLSNWSATECLINTVITKVKNERAMAKLKRSLLLCYVKQENWKQGAAVGLQLRSQPDFSSEDCNLLAQCLIHEGKVEDDILDQLRDTQYYDSLLALRHITKNELTEARSILESSSSSTADRWLYLGMVYWKLKEKDKCLMPLLRATKLDPSRANSFLYLGHYYKEYGNNLDKAKKCYMKAYSLDGSSSEVAHSLSEVYRQLGDEEANYELMQKVSNTLESSESWARLQLGLHHLSRRRWDEAIQCLRGVVRATPKDSLAWESLGDAYYSRRSFTSALKCYTKVVELSPNNSVYAQTQMATVNQLLGLHEEAVDEYKMVLANAPEYLMALKGISDTLKVLAEEELSQQMYRTSRENAQQAVEYAVRAIAVSPNFSCLWKLLGDTLTLMTKYPTKYAYAHIPGKFLGQNSDETVYKMKLDIFPLAISCYSRSIKLTMFDPIPLYYDVSITYKALYEESGEVDHCRRAFAVAEHCVKNKPGEWQYWNLLGVLSMSEAIDNEAFAQCCFLKALVCNRACPEAWTNLGVLYLKKSNHRIANKTFKRAQEDDPDYVSSWIGQALIAEVVKEEEAMDLFRHAASLGYHTEAALGYADWVCKTLQKHDEIDAAKYKYAIDNVQAIPVALDLMTWLCAYRPRDSKVATLLGLLQERMGLLRNAADSYTTSIEASTTQKEKNVAAVNLGRICLRTGTYQRALDILQQVTEATFNSAYCTAIALYRTENYDDAYNALDTMLHWLAESETEKADLLVAMAGSMYKLKGADEAKTLLFQSIKAAKIPTPCSLFATCALGLLHSDKGLSKLALNELKRYEKEPRYVYDIALLTSYLHRQEEEFEKASEAMRVGVELCPHSVRLWRSFAQLLLQDASVDAEHARSSVQKAIELSAASVGTSIEMSAVASVAEHLCTNKDSARLLAQKAIHVDPEKVDNWAALIFTILADAIDSERRVWLKNVISYARRRLDITRPMGLWLGLVERMVEKHV